MSTQAHAERNDDTTLVEVMSASLYPGASIASIQLAIGYCRAAGLDPLQKPVHIVPMWDAKSRGMRDVIMPGIGLYRTQAARNGCAGVSEPEFGPEVTADIGGQKVTYPTWCRVTVRRRQPCGAVDEFTAVERWMENYAAKGGAEKSIAPNAMWTRRPYGQLAKCAEAQALRRAFPELGTAPTADEMAGKEIAAEYVDAVEIRGGASPSGRRELPPTLPPYAAEAFDKNLPAWAKLVAEGKKSPSDLLATLSTKATFSEEQKARVLSLKRAPDPAPAPPPAAGEHADFVGAMEAAEAAGSEA